MALRSTFIALSKARWAQRAITRWGFAWRAASRFIAGETTGEALHVVKQLNARGISATLDHLGEHTSQTEDARQAAQEIAEALAAIQSTGVKSNISIKLSQLGLVLDEHLCRENLKTILDAARTHSNFIRIDMEDASLTEKTVAMYEWARREGYDQVGLVLQAYLYRSADDIERLAPLEPRIRLCKGAYKEPPEVAFPKKSDVDANFDRLAARLLELSAACGAPHASPDGRIPPVPAFATHDPLRIQFAIDTARRLNLPSQAVEFQMLYGIRRDLQESTAAQGQPVRVYVPYGTHWYPYFMRRLAERPANVWFFISNFFRK